MWPTLLTMPPMILSRGNVHLPWHLMTCPSRTTQGHSHLTHSSGGWHLNTEGPHVLHTVLLDYYCQHILDEDFPELNHQLVSLQQQQNQIAISLRELVRDNCSAQEMEHTEGVSSKSKCTTDMLGEVGLQKLLYWLFGKFWPLPKNPNN
jgi:hypothetical protein